MLKSIHLLLLTACLAAACSDTTNDPTETQPGALDCGVGSVFAFLDDEVCVYDEDLADLEFTCPEAVPVTDYFSGFVVCSEDGVDSSIEEAVYEAHPELRPAPPAPCTEDSFSPNHSEGSAAALTFGESYDLIVCPEEDFEEQWDYWTVELAAGQWLTAIITSDNYAIDIRRTAPDRPTDFRDTLFGGIAGGSYAGPWQRTVGAVTFQAAEATTYEFHVARLFGSEYESHQYHLELAQGCYLDSDCGEGLACNRQLLACLPPMQLSCGDDASEPNNTDATATPLLTDGTAITGLALCDQDFDRFAFAADVGDSLEITVEHDQGEDGSIAVYLLGADGSVEASEARPSHQGTIFRMPHVRGGDYQLLVDGVDFDSGAVNYDISLTKGAGGCADNSECSHQPTRERAHCAEDGACVGIDGRGDVALGDLCDADTDCVYGTYCSPYGEVATNWVCTIECEGANGCDAVGQGAYCQPYACEGFGPGECLPACDTDASCLDGLLCTDGRCSECDSDDDCGGDAHCDSGRCVDVCDDEG
jgi:hypothetical protein